MEFVKRLLEALRTNGAAIIELNKALLTRNDSIKDTLDRVKNGVATKEEIEEAIALAEENHQGILRAIEANAQTDPAIKSPEKPLETGEELKPVEIPEEVDEINVTPNEQVGVEGTVNIDLPEVIAG